MEEFGLDGHWLISAVIGHINRQYVDLSAPGLLFDQQLSEMIAAISNDLYEDIFNGYEAEGFDDDHLARLDASLEEHMPRLLEATERILVETYNVLGNYSSPEYCQSPTVDRYLVGYSMMGDHSGCFHFHFDDS